MKRIACQVLQLTITVYILTSCGESLFDNVKAKRNTSQFVNLDSIILDQVKRLEGRKLDKNVFLDGRKEELLLIPDSALLMTDLKAFSDIDLSKPTFLGEYDISEENNHKSFVRKGKKGPQQVRVTMDNDKLVLIEGEYSESNMLYGSVRNYLLRFDQTTNELTEYQFSGYQKLIFKDTVFFGIKGKFRP